MSEPKDKTYREKPRLGIILTELVNKNSNKKISEAEIIGMGFAEQAIQEHIEGKVLEELGGLLKNTKTPAEAGTRLQNRYIKQLRGSE